MSRTPDTGAAASARKYTITAGELCMTVTDLGATILELWVPDAEGKQRDVVLGYETLEEYKNNSCYFGAMIGRNANRIAGASFELDGRTVRMDANENGNSLHSGPDGYETRIWKAEKHSEDSITFSLHSPDGDQGFPGALDVCVTYALSEDGTLLITTEGRSDADTVFNPTNHSYFNLNGHASGNVCGQFLTISADAFSEAGEGMIPTGVHLDVSGTAFDFRSPHRIGERIGADEEQLLAAGGYDHNYFISGPEGEMRPAAEVYSEDSGICLRVSSDLPCLQFYAGNGIPEGTGKGGALYGPRQGFALETQFCPDAVHRPEEQQCVLRAGERFVTRTVWKFACIR